MKPYRLALVPLAIAGLTLQAVAASPVPADQPAGWWRGNLHTHSFWSDGNDFPEMIVEWYHNNGYNFLCMSDHNVLSRGEKWVAVEHTDRKSQSDAFPKYLDRFGADWIETRSDAESGALQVRLKPLNEFRALFEQANQFILIESEEITDKTTGGLAVHMNAVNLAETIPPPGGETVREVILSSLALVREQQKRIGRPILFQVNHLNYKWSITAEDLAGIIDNQFFEVWNGVETDNDPGDALHPSSDDIWDVVNTLRILSFGVAPLYATATDDSHDYHGHTTRAMPGRAWVQVWCRHLTPESIIKAMRAGDFYASTGVQLDSVRFDGKSLNIAIVPESGVSYTTRFVGSRKGVNTSGVARRDAGGNVVLTTLDYASATAPQIGEVFAEAAGTDPAYALTGDELYVRAIIVSDAQPAVPSSEYPVKRAWTQPVGWEGGPIVNLGGKAPPAAR